MLIAVEGSSIFNIDFAAGIFAGILNPDQDMNLLLNELPFISPIEKNRKFISRLSFPTMRWLYSMKEGNYSNDNVWHLKFISSDQLNPQNVETYLLEIVNSFSFFQQDNCSTKFENDIRNRSKHLLDLSKTIKNNKKNNWDILFYAEVIQYIFNETLKGNLKIKFLGGFNKLDTTAYNKSNILLSQLFQELKSLPKKEYKFIKGGYIEICKINSQPLKADTISLKDNSTLELKNSKSNKSYSFKVPPTYSNVSLKKLQKYDFACRGPIQMLLLRKFGVLAHLPWYGDAVLIDKAHHPCHEYISPISVSSALRVTKRFNGEGQRLTPSGYSLIEYECDEVLALIRGLLNEPEISFESLDDWKDIVNNFPQSNEKLAEHQREVIPYYTWNQKMLNKKYKSGWIVSSNYLFQSADTIAFPQYGAYIIEVSSFLNHIRSVIAPGNDIHLADHEVSFLMKKGWIDDNFNLDIFPIANQIEFILNRCLSKLVDLGFSNKLQKELSSNIGTQIQKLKATRYFPIIKTDLNQFLQYKHIYHLSKYVQKVLEHYYSFSSFFISTVLKANIFTCYLLFGPDQYKKLIKDLFEKRGVIKFLQFKPIFFEDSY